MHKTCSQLSQLLHSEIPLSRQMGIQVIECEANRVILNAPLDPNINHKCTAFGGSLYSVAVLCGWSLIYTQLEKHQLSGHIVIQHSEVDYIIPVDGDIRACCEIIDTAAFERFLKTLKRKKMARISLSTVIQYNNRDAVNFRGDYVVHY